MRIEFHGAANGEVTGSCHFIEAACKRILFDCSMMLVATTSLSGRGAVRANR